MGQRMQKSLVVAGGLYSTGGAKPGKEPSPNPQQACRYPLEETLLIQAVLPKRLSTQLNQALTNLLTGRI